MKAAVAKYSIAKGMYIKKEMIEEKKIPKTKNILYYDEAIGKIAKRWIEKGRMIKKGDVKEPYLIQKGSVIKVIYDKSPIRIEIEGVALEKGKKGDIIRVRNKSSSKVIRCKVVSSKLVEFAR